MKMEQKAEAAIMTSWRLMATIFLPLLLLDMFNVKD